MSSLPPEWQQWYEGKTFTSDWTSKRLRTWADLLAGFVGKSVDVLEIGSWEGRSAIFFLEYLKPSRITCIDTFSGGEEHQVQRPHDLVGLEARFDRNTEGYSNLEKIPARSILALDRLVGERRQYDVIYVDGSHDMDDALMDSIMTWRLLRVDGILIWDDYRWSPGMKRAIDIFLAYRSGEYQMLHHDRQVIVRRTSNSPVHYERQLKPVGTEE